MGVTVISGGQTGVDRAALDVALRLGLPCGGWCPRGRRAEDGRISPAYPLKETDAPEYEVRTERNVQDADGTLILTAGEPVGGTALTIVYAKQWGRPYLVADLAGDARVEPVAAWMGDHNVRVLNVAGPRESTSPGVHQRAMDFLVSLLTPFAAD